MEAMRVLEEWRPAVEKFWSPVDMLKMAKAVAVEAAGSEASTSDGEHDHTLLDVSQGAGSLWARDSSLSNCTIAMTTDLENLDHQSDPEKASSNSNTAASLASHSTVAPPEEVTDKEKCSAQSGQREAPAAVPARRRKTRRHSKSEELTSGGSYWCGI
jgi:hypothetical protein